MKIQSSLLPLHKVTCGIVNFECPSINGIDLIRVHKNQNINSPVSSHADVNVCYVGDGQIFVANEQRALAVKLRSLGFDVTVIKDEMSAKYPADCLLNAAVFGNTAILNPKTICIELLNALKSRNFKIIEVNQGYSKCSVLPVSENAIITTDRAICDKCKQNEIDALLVTTDGISLNGYNYGFIGGCGGLISKDTMLFFGDIDKHPDGEMIRAFLDKYNIKTVKTLGDLTDYGSFIPILET